MSDITLNCHNVTRVTTTIVHYNRYSCWRELTIESKDGSRFRVNLYGDADERSNLNTVLVDDDGMEVKP